MTSEIDEFRKGLVAAVQAELERHASAVVAEVDRLRDEGRRERDEMRQEIRDQIAALSAVVDQSQAGSAAYADRARAALEKRIEESESRQTRRIDDATSGLDGVVAEALRPAVGGLKDDYEAMSHKVDGLDANLRRFDEQAARMVTYFNDVSSQVEAKQEELGEALKAEIAAEIGTLTRLVEENDSAIRRFQNEVGQSVSAKVNDAEDRFNNRLLAAESRMKEDAGTKIAEIQAHVGRVSSGLDDTMTVINDRMAALDDRFVTADRRIEQLAESVAGVDQDELEALRDKMSSAAGEAMLVRIEMERLEKSVAERTDGLVVRMTDVETQLQDATMDVSTAVQLDRLEEIERSLLELDPSQFVRKSESSNESVKNDAAAADENVGVSAVDGHEM
jgi:archaellum component FlaC